MGENGQGSGRRPFGDLTNVLGKRSAPSDLEKSAGGIKIVRVEKASEQRKEFDETAKASGGAARNTLPLFDGITKENLVRSSIFRETKIQHMAAEAAGLLSKESDDVRNRTMSLGSSGLHDREQESSLESEGGCEDEEEDDDMDSEFLAYTRGSCKMATNDGECLTQEETAGSSGNQKPLSSFDFATGFDNMPYSNVHHSLGNDGLEDADTTKSCACSFCLKAAFMWTDIHYQDARGRLAAMKKSIKFARSLGTRSQGNEYAVNASRYNLKRAAEMEFELYQQKRSLFLHTENVLIRESAQLHSSLVKLKELRENCKTDLEMMSGSSLEK
ncbi:uncharacterized protein LOC102706535 [Oryza brachyantha]|uniref:Uncharacterized protein n=1 Tax=Oryza brachyantha TaxID=4533 RepID=J3LH54_ORYBR|nr:uncharacterized protein LOC102706535 [Oryza brachyantha]